MKTYRLQLKDLKDQELLILVNQKQEESFTKYVKTILTERYLSDDISLQELSKKLKTSKNDFQKQILWDAISTRILVEKGNNQIIRSYYLMEDMPIDDLVQVAVKAENSKIKDQAIKLCRQKEEELEKSLDFSDIEYEKYDQDQEEFAKEKNTTSSRDKPKISKGRQFDLSITTRKFLQNFFGIDCLQAEKLSHEQMEQVLLAKGITVPRHGRIQNISYDQVATGEYILVRNETNKQRNARIIPYMNPFSTSIESLSKEITVQYQKRI